MTDWAVVANWFKYWKAQGMMKVYAQAYHNLVPHGKEVKADVAQLVEDWDDQKFFITGQDFARIMQLALPLPSEEVFLQ